jgi:hypothetical protein
MWRCPILSCCCLLRPDPLFQFFTTWHSEPAAVVPASPREPSGLPWRPRSRGGDGCRRVGRLQLLGPRRRDRRPSSAGQGLHADRPSSRHRSVWRRAGRVLPDHAAAASSRRAGPGIWVRGGSENPYRVRDALMTSQDEAHGPRPLDFGAGSWPAISGAGFSGGNARGPGRRRWRG